MNDDESKSKPRDVALLTKEQMDTFIDAVVQGFDIELARLLNDKDKIKVIDQYLALYHSANYFTFFTPMSMLALTDRIFTDAVQRNFIMNLTERVSMVLCSHDLSFDDRFANSIAKAITNNKVSASGSRDCLINSELRESIEISNSVAKTVVTNNLWLIVLYVLVTYFQRSVFFQNYTEKTSQATT